MVYLNGQRIAIQNTANNNAQAVWRFYENPATGSTRGTSTKMASEPDPLGVNNRTSAPIEPPDTSGSVPDFILPSRIVDPSNMTNGCQWGGLPISCDAASELSAEETRIINEMTDENKPSPSEITAGNQWTLDNMNHEFGHFLTSSDPRSGSSGGIGSGGVSEIPGINDGGQDTCVNGVCPSVVTVTYQPSTLVSNGQTQQYEMPTRKELRDRLVNRLDMNNGRCRTFLDAVRDNLGIEKTFEQLFDGISEFVYVQGRAGISGESHVDNNPKAIGLTRLPSKTDPKEKLLQKDRYINFVFHELIHRAGVESHKKFARAGFDALSEKEQKNHSFPTKKDKLPEDNMDETFSRYFSRLINDYCRPPS